RRRWPTRPWSGTCSTSRYRRGCPASSSPAIRCSRARWLRCPPYGYSNDAIGHLERADDIHARDHLAEHRVLAVEAWLRAERDVHLTVGPAGIAGVRHRDGAGDVRARLRDLGDADWRPAAHAAPVALLPH